MSKLRHAIISTIIIGIIILGTSCNTSAENKKDDEIVISASATHYDFPLDNILKYKGIIIDEDFIIYVFGGRSELVEALNNTDDVKLWTEYNNISKRKTTDEWKLIQNIENWYLVIYCDPSNYDIEAGIVVSNCLEDDGYTIDFQKVKRTIMSIWDLEAPRLLIQELDEEDLFQYFENGTWSEISRKGYTNWDP